MTFRAYLWQKRRRFEKIDEINHRKKLLNIGDISLNQLNTISRNNLEEFTKVSFNAEFMPDCDKDYVQIIKTNESEPGYKLILPVKLKNYNTEKDIQKNIIFVDFGWFSESVKIKDAISSLNKTIEGVVYYGDKKSKYTNNDTKKRMFITLHIDELMEVYPQYSQNIINDIMIKRINFSNSKSVSSDSSKAINSVIPSSDDLLVWYISPQTHLNYSRFWLFATLGNLITNAYIWCIL